jgi:hypothetical protein
MGGKGLFLTRRQVVVGMQGHSYNGCSVIVITDMSRSVFPSAVVHGAAPGLAFAVAAAPLFAAAASAVCSATVITAAARAGCLPSPCLG